VRIGIFQPSFVGAGGVEKVIAETVLRVPEYDWTLYALRYDSKNVERFFPQMKKVNVTSVPTVNVPNWLPSRLRRPETDSFLELVSYRRFLSSNRIDEDLVIAHLSFATVVPFYTNIPAIWYCHCATRYLYEEWIQKEIEDLIGLTPFWARWLRNYLRKTETSCARKFVKILCNSEHTKNKLKKYFDSEADVVYPGVELPPETQPLYGNTFIFPCRLNYYKRVDIAIKATALLRDIPELRLKIIGKGMAEKSLKTLVKDMKLTSVDFVDSVPDLAEEYRDALGVVYLPKDEDFGIVPLEAMAYQRPVIGANEGGLCETIIDGMTGFLVKADPLVVAAKMRQLFLDRNMTAAMGNAGRLRAANFSWDSHVEQLRRYIQEIV
jgi:glycosyltransferase involved in cell wall biosynthesis